MIEAIVEYWFVIATVFLSLCNVYLVGSHWRRVANNWNDKSGLKDLLLPGIISCIVFGSIGMISLGYTGTAETENIRLEGVVHKATIQALETEARNREDTITHTRKELEALRRNYARLKADVEREAFNNDVKHGQDDMFQTRERLMNREKDGK